MILREGTMGEIKLKVHTCENLKLDVDRGEGKLVTITLRRLRGDEKRVVDVGAMRPLYAENTMCTLTNHNCVLSRYNGTTRKINFEDRERCPGFKPSSRDYLVKGDEIDNVIYEVHSIKRAD